MGARFATPRPELTDFVRAIFEAVQGFPGTMFPAITNPMH